MQSNNNILIAQGGGPTNVINQSLVGIINGEKNKNSNIIGAINGVRGIIDNNFIKLSKFNDVTLKKIQNTFLHCFYDSEKTSFFFENLTSKNATDFSRYNMSEP